MYLFILYITNIFAANVMKSTTDSIWTNLMNKSISKHALSYHWIIPILKNAYILELLLTLISTATQTYDVTIR